MTLTENRPDAPAAQTLAPTSADVAVPESPGLAGWLLTTDHKRVGRLFLVSSLLAVVGALVLGVLSDLERMDGESFDVIGSDVAVQVQSLHVLGLILLGIVPLMLGLAIALVPLQVGARSIAFPRLAALSYWMWLLGGLTLVGCYIANGGPGGGDIEPLALSLVSLGVVAVGLMAGWISVVTTVFTLRTPGMGLDDVPFLSFSSVVSGVVLLLTLPALLGELIVLYVDHTYGGGFTGSSNDIVGRLAWFSRQPQVYAYALPAFGILLDVVPVFARARLRPVPVLQGVLILAGFLAIGSYAQSISHPDLVEEPLYILMSYGALLPVLAVLALAGLAIRSGTPTSGAPQTWVLLAGLLLLLGAALGALGAVPPLELAGTAWDEAQSRAVLLGALVAGLGAVAFWGPKLWGRTLPAGPLKGLGLLGLVGVGLASLPLAVAGLIDQPAASPTFATEDGTGILNLLAAAGLALTALVVLGVALLALKGFRTGPAAGDDPWEGHTLEWATSSPPPPANFPAPLEPVISDRPLLDRRLANPATEVAN